MSYYLEPDIHIRGKVKIAEINKLDINKLVYVPTGLKNVDYLDVGKLKTVPVDLNKIK